MHCLGMPGTRGWATALAHGWSGLLNGRPCAAGRCRWRSILGGLAAAHDLSGDEALGLKAKDLADRLLPAFDSAPTGRWRAW